MAYKFDELNTVNIWNIYDKVRDDNAAIKFCQRYGLLRQTPNCAIHGTAYVLEEHKNTYNFINGSAIEKDTNAVQKLISEKEAFVKDHTSLSLLLFAFFTVGHLIFSIILIIRVTENSVSTIKFYRVFFKV